MQKNKCTLRVATYNIWNNIRNDGLGQEERANQILHEIHAIHADVIGLQEVKENFFHKYLCTNPDCPYNSFFKYNGEDEGLAILSQYPLEDPFFLHTSLEYAESNALNVIAKAGKLRISFTNLHLPWNSARQQEKQITAIDRYIHAQTEKADFFVLAGDFNGNINSSVNRFLLGDQTIEGIESNPYWNDLQSGYCIRKGIPLTATLDFINNPRWNGKDTIAVPMVADRIYVMESRDDIAMNELEIFGTDISKDTGMCASDHYGIVVELQFEKNCK